MGCSPVGLSPARLQPQIVWEMLPVTASNSQLRQLRRRLGQTLGWLGLGAGLLAGGLLLSVLSGMTTVDEMFVLQVARRVFLAHQALYREIYFVATPLSIYLAGLAVWLRSEVLVTRALSSLVFAGMGLLAARLGEQVGLGRRFRLFLALGMLALASPWVMGTGGLYTPLGYLLMMATFPLAYELLQAPAGRATRSDWLRLAACGALAGLSFAAKQTTGVYTLAFLLAALAWRGWDRRGQAEAGRAWLAENLALGGAFGALVGLAVLLPVGLNGGLPKFLDYAFLAKRIYVQIAAISYGVALQRFAAQVVNPGQWTGMFSVFVQQAVLLPPLSLAGLAWAGWRGKEQLRPAAFLGLASAAALADIFPRVVIGHIACCVPVLLVALGYAVRGLPARLRSALPTLLLAWLGLSLVCSYAPQVTGLLRGSYFVSDVPRLRGLLLPKGQLEEARGLRAEVRRYTGDAPVLFMSTGASYFYILTGIQNPSPFDFPLVADFGLHGEDETVAAIADGAIPWVCIQPMGDYYLRPAALEEYVLSHLQPVADLGICQLMK